MSSGGHHNFVTVDAAWELFRRHCIVDGIPFGLHAEDSRCSVCGPCYLNGFKYTFKDWTCALGKKLYFQWWVLTADKLHVPVGLTYD